MRRRVGIKLFWFAVRVYALADLVAGQDTYEQAVGRFECVIDESAGLKDRP